MVNPQDNSIINCQMQNCYNYVGDGTDLCPLANGIMREPCCSSVQNFINNMCVGDLNQTAVRKVCPQISLQRK